MKRLLDIIFIIICLLCTYHSIAQIDTAKLDKALTEIAQQGHFNGFVVGVVSQEEVLYTKAFGWADRASQKPYSVVTNQNIASVSKTLIGISLLRAQEMGLLKLDDPINEHLPFKVTNPYFPAVPITIRHLATHTSTIKDTKNYDKYAYVLENAADANLEQLKKMSEDFQLPEKALSIEGFMKRLLLKDGSWYKKKNYLKKAPGTRFEYSNVGATLAAFIIEKVAGIPYADFTKRYILRPLEMKNSGWTYEEVGAESHSNLYGDMTTKIPKYRLVTYPDGGFRTNMEDFSKYVMELMKGQAGQGTLLNPESYAELFKPQLTEKEIPSRNPNNAAGDEYNTGIFMGYTAANWPCHTGGDPGVSTFFYINPETNLGVILFVNTSLYSKESVDQYISIGSELFALLRQQE